MKSGDPDLVVQGADGRRLDLGRDVHAVFGLPFDAIDLPGTVALLRRRAAQGEPCFLSTPNLNFAIAARDDPAFRRSVLQSDLCVPDGMPIVWMARLLGAPLRERVAGSELFERLRREPLAGQAPLRVYFFGGPPGAAEAAVGALAREGGGVVGVGYDAAGFGTVEDMSSEATIERINASGADFVMVSIGARKGQAWILRNRARLRAPLVSYLGATVNFVAGGVRRAPRWMRAGGLEWLWRTIEEPALWRRYARDAAALAGMLRRGVLPWLLVRGRSRAAQPPRWQVQAEEASTRIRLEGDWRGAPLGPLRLALAQGLRRGPAQFDLTGATSIDAALAGLLLLLEGWQVLPPVVPGSVRAPAMRRALAAMGCAGFAR